jgi:hypothetical protein
VQPYFSQKAGLGRVNKKGFRLEPLTEWDQAALKYLDAQRKLDALKIAEVGVNFGIEFYY